MDHLSYSGANTNYSGAIQLSLRAHFKKVPIQLNSCEKILSLIGINQGQPEVVDDSSVIQPSVVYQSTWVSCHGVQSQFCHYMVPRLTGLSFNCGMNNSIVSQSVIQFKVAL